MLPYSESERNITSHNPSEFYSAPLNHHDKRDGFTLVELDLSKPTPGAKVGSLLTKPHDC
jgi:hypothetical protein